MPNLNDCRFMGNLGADPEMRFTPKGTPVTTASIAVNWYGKTDGNIDFDKNGADWIRLTAYGDTATRLNELHKGDSLYVETTYRTRSWTDDKKETHYAHSFIIRRIKVLRLRNGHEPAETIEDDAVAVEDS